MTMALFLMGKEKEPSLRMTEVEHLTSPAGQELRVEIRVTTRKHRSEIFLEDLFIKRLWTDIQTR